MSIILFTRKWECFLTENFVRYVKSAIFEASKVELQKTNVMRKSIIVFVLLFIACVSYAQFPVSSPVCVECDEKGQSNCPYHGSSNDDDDNTSSNTPSKPSTTPSKPTTTPKPSSTPAARKFAYQCTLCNASILAYNVNDAIREFAVCPWYHKPTCQNYKPKSGQNQSTSLKDYTPMPERPAQQNNAKPAKQLSCPIAQRTPRFSSINEESILYSDPQSLAGAHQWGEVDMEAIEAYNAKYSDEPIPLQFVTEDYTHTAGRAVVLGAVVEADGVYSKVWHILVKGPNGKYVPAEILSQKQSARSLSETDYHRLRSAGLRSEGTFIIKEYDEDSKGYYKEIISTKTGKIIEQGYNISFPNYTVDGKHFVLLEPDNNRGAVLRDLYWLRDDEGKTIAFGNNLDFYDDAIVVYRDNCYQLCNWYGEAMTVPDGEWGEYFADVKAYNNNGSFYLIETMKHHFAVVGRGFKRVGGLYNTREEALAAWANR